MKFKMYTTSTCGYCKLAKQWLSSNGHAYEEILLDDPAKRQAFKENHPTMRTVPQIFLINDDGTETHIGGYTELSAPHPSIIMGK